jgi:hypothetical protein
LTVFSQQHFIAMRRQKALQKVSVESVIVSYEHAHG